LEKRNTEIVGCFELFPKKIEDSRGVFVKTFQKSIFELNRLSSDWVEEY
jgi:dTDP-4-dehydrorhamnose 3,5-epimerase-like enzyme